MSTIQAINKVVSSNFSSSGVLTTTPTTIATTSNIKSNGRPILFGIQRSSTATLDEITVFKATGTVVQMELRFIRTEIGGSTITLSKMVVGANDGSGNGAGVSVPNSIVHLDLDAVKGKTYNYYLEAKLITSGATAILMGSLFAVEL